MAPWERPVVVFLRDEAHHLTGDEDRIDAAMQDKLSHLSLSQAWASLQELYSQL